MNRLKVAIYTGSYPDTTFLTLLARGLVDNGMEVHIYGKLVKKSELDKGIKFYAYSSKSKVCAFLFLFKYCFLNLLFNFKKMQLFFKKIKKDSLYKKYRKSLVVLPILYHNPDIVHLQWLHSYETFKGLDKVITSKLIVSLRGRQLSISSFIYPELQKLTIEATNKVAKIHSISDDLTNQLLEINPGIIDKIIKINPAIDLNLFSTSNSFLNQDKQSRLRIISVCRLTWIKGLVNAIGALKLASDNGINFEYQIIGGGEQMEELYYMINDLGLSNKIKLLGKMPQIEIKDYLLNADVFLMPSIEEGFCNAVIEAQALGLPCLVSDAGGLEENIENEKTGFVFRKRNIVDLSLLIEKFSEMPSDEYIRMKKNAVERSRLKYDVNNQIEQFKNLYLNV